MKSLGPLGAAKGVFCFEFLARLGCDRSLLSQTVYISRSPLSFSWHAKSWNLCDILASCLDRLGQFLALLVELHDLISLSLEFFDFGTNSPELFV